jgi:hypothetical protein
MKAQSHDQAEGERRKADALVLLAARRETTIRRAQRALLRALLESGTATADDVRAAVELPPGINPKLFGAVPSTLARAGIIRRAGYATTGRPAAHARPVSVWTLADRDAAVRWLADHPDLPDLDDDQAGLHQGLLFDNQETATPTGATAGAAL